MNKVVPKTTLFGTRPMNIQQKEKWAKVRAKGRFRFVLIYGVLIYGAVFLILGYLCEALFETIRSYVYSVAYVSPKPPYFISKIVIALICGALIGFIIWRFNEKAYRNADVN